MKGPGLTRMIRLTVLTSPITETRTSLPIGRWIFCDNCKDYTYVGTLDGLYQHTLIATGTRLRPVEATFLGHIWGTKPAKHILIGLRPFKAVLIVILGLLKFV